MGTSNITIQIDENLKLQAEEIFASAGLDISAAITLFLEQSVRVGGFPFRVDLENPESVIARKQVENGEGETFSGVDEWWVGKNKKN